MAMRLPKTSTKDIAADPMLMLVPATVLRRIHLRRRQREAVAALVAVEIVCVESVGP